MRRIALLALLLAAALGRALAAGTVIEDVVYRPDGGYAKGHVQISWDSFVDPLGRFIPGGVLRADIGASGAFKLELAPGTYQARYMIGAPRQEWWIVPASSQTLKIKDVRVPAPPAEAGSQVHWADALAAVYEAGTIDLAAGTVYGAPGGGAYWAAPSGGTTYACDDGRQSITQYCGWWMVTRGRGMKIKDAERRASQSEEAIFDLATHGTGDPHTIKANGRSYVLYELEGETPLDLAERFRAALLADPEIDPLTDLGTMKLHRKVSVTDPVLIEWFDPEEGYEAYNGSQTLSANQVFLVLWDPWPGETEAGAPYYFSKATVVLGGTHALGTARLSVDCTALREVGSPLGPAEDFFFAVNGISYDVTLVFRRIGLYRCALRK